MNSKGQVWGFTLMFGLVILILTLALAGPTKESIDNARSPTVNDTIGLDCGNSSISDFDKAACLTSDLTIFYFVGGVIFIAGGILTARVIFS